MDLESLITKFFEEAKSQMQPLNDLYPWHIAAMLFSKTIPLVNMNTSLLSKDYIYFLEEYGISDEFLMIKT